MPEENRDITLKTGELSNREEFGRGIVRMDSKAMRELGIREGDIVELKGQRKTGVIAVRAYPGDINLSLIRMDGITRRNAGIGVGESIKLAKAEVKNAKRIVLAPAQKGIIIQMDPEMLKRNLLFRPVAKKDLITPFPVARERRGPFDDMDFLQEVFGFRPFTPIPGETRFAVVSTNPEGIVRITEETEVELKPEAVEIEEKAIPTLTYEDIGGLSEAIQKIREMVELPLRHPELFTKLGIDPPKGVLLYGPPGTGKTLLAKAVANESGASFYSIAGPEVMSKWYGESLPSDEHLMVLEDGRIKYMPIGEIVERRKDVKVVSFDENGKVKFSKIKDYFKHPFHGKILEIKTKTGRRIKVTDYHSLFTVKNGRPESIKTSELVPKESYIAIPKKIPLLETGRTKFNLIEEFKDDDKMLIKGIAPYVKKAVEKIGIKNVAEILGVKRKYVYDIYGKNVGLKINKFIRLMGKSLMEYDPVLLRISAKFDKGSIPALIKLDEGLLRLFGLWLAEGDFNKGSIRISSPAEEHKEDIRKTCKGLDLNASIYKNCIMVCSEPLKSFMESLGFNRYAVKKRIPGFIYTLPENLIREFLKGYYSGDGSVYPNQRGILTVEATTYSEGLANDLLYLLLQTGIVGSIYSDKTGNSLRKRICFRGSDNIVKFSKIGFMDKKRNDMIMNYASSLLWKRSDQIPIFTELGNLLKGSKIAKEWANSSTIGRNKLIGFLEKIDPEKTYQNIWNLVNNEIYWDRVEEITEVPYSHEYTYDISINPAENFVAGFGGIFAHNSEANLRKIFEEAEKTAPSIIFIDEVDAIAPKREEVTGEVERRVVSTLLTQMDGLKSRGKVIVIAATNRENSIDPALRRGGRFDREVEIGVPDQKGRKEILQIHTRNMPLTKDVDLNYLASITYGYVGADLEALCKESAMSALRSNLPAISWKKEEELPPETLEKLKVTKQDFQNALKLVEPSAMREVLVEIPNVKWSDIGGLDEVKGLLKEVVEWPLKNPDSFKRIGIRPPSGVLLYGPPGTGKTLLAKAVANESGANFISIKGPEVYSKWVGESEKQMRDIFRRAKQVAPCIVFFDEIDAIAPRRGLEVGTRVSENVVSTILTEMSGLEEMHNIIVIAATNRPDMLDPAILRPGRFDRQILVPSPDEKSRLQILKIHTKNMPMEKDVDIAKIAKELDSYTGADIENIIREAGLNALREDIKAKIVKRKHFEAALKKIKPSVDAKVIEFYSKMAEKFRKPVKEKAEEVEYVG